MERETHTQRDRETETDTQTDKQTDTDTDRKTERETETETETERQSDREGDRDRQRQKQIFYDLFCFRVLFSLHRIAFHHRFPNVWLRHRPFTNRHAVLFSVFRHSAISPAIKRQAKLSDFLSISFFFSRLKRVLADYITIAFLFSD